MIGNPPLVVVVNLSFTKLLLVSSSTSNSSLPPSSISQMLAFNPSDLVANLSAILDLPSSPTPKTDLNFTPLENHHHTFDIVLCREGSFSLHHLTEQFLQPKKPTWYCFLDCLRLSCFGQSHPL